MEDPEHRPHRQDANDNDEEEERRRREEEMERLMLAQEEEEALNREAQDNHEQELQQQEQQAGQGQLEQQQQLQQQEQQQQQQQRRRRPQQQIPSKSRFSYIFVSYSAALALVWYALRTRQQWYLALVFLGSSKWAYIVLGNALIASCITIFRFVTRRMLGGLRLVESEGLAEFFRWNITDTCLALTMFRHDLDVETAVLFLCLVLGKCLHWVVETREGHLRMTQDAVVPIQNGPFRGLPIVQKSHIGLILLVQVLIMADFVAVLYCVQDITQNGMSVHLLFGFEGAILLATAVSLIMLWCVHFIDGMLHFIHDETGFRIPGILHGWREYKPTLVFAIEVQAQGAKFLFYCTFFGIVLSFYGLPLNLFREVYSSFQSLRGRLVAFTKYRRLMSGLNRFPSVRSEEALDDAGRICIICRDEMTLRDCKQLPGCGHVFHKSCLREWLVQQQTCPTCRCDIVANEARLQAQRQLEEQEEAEAENGQMEREVDGIPALQEREQPQQNERDEQPVQEQQQVAHTRRAPIQQQHDQQQQQQQTLSPDDVRNLRMQRMQRELPAPGQVSAPRDLMSELADDEPEQKPKLSEHLYFPALYRVIANNPFVINWEEQKIMRFLNQNVVVLCYEMQDMREVDGTTTTMLRLPDGWIRADCAMRLVGVPK